MTETATVHSLRAVGMSDTGRVRLKNEDAYRIDLEAGLFLVADGMGGHRSGEVASEMAVQLLPGLVRERAEALDENDTGGEAERIFALCIAEVSRQIRTASLERPDCQGMGTTLVAVWIRDGRVHVAHMGDSRAYLFRDGELTLLTEDHSVVNMLVQLGALQAEDADGHPALNQLTRFAGISEPVGPDVHTMPRHPGDRLLLCSDGLWGPVSFRYLEAAMAETKTPRGACRRLLQQANAAGGPDNITALVVDLH